VAEHRELVVAVGGDGTINEVVNGLLGSAAPPAITTRLGLLPMGTGGDLRRTLGIPRDVDAAAAILRSGRSRRVDAGRVTCAVGGETVTRHFINVADAGIGGEVAGLVNRGFRLVNGETTFTAAGAIALLRWRNKRMRLLVDGAVSSVIAQQVIVANCEYAGGGMRIAAGALPDDGLLDVIVIGDVGKLDTLGLMASVRKGTHLGHPKIFRRLGRHIEISSDEHVGVDLDGECPGTLPATFDVVPSALEVVVP
jgi:YegS/Rv2252/BmrU family lipid kinase